MNGSPKATFSSSPVAPFHDGPEDATDQVSDTSTRRSGRNRKKPVRFNDYVMSHVQTIGQDDWRDRVSVLLHLINVFPLNSIEICNAILYVTTHRV